MYQTKENENEPLLWAHTKKAQVLYEGGKIRLASDIWQQHFMTEDKEGTYLRYSRKWNMNQGFCIQPKWSTWYKGYRPAIVNIQENLLKNYQLQQHKGWSNQIIAERKFYLKEAFQPRDMRNDVPGRSPPHSSYSVRTRQCQWWLKPLGRSSRHGSGWCPWTHWSSDITPVEQPDLWLLEASMKYSCQKNETWIWLHLHV